MNDEYSRRILDTKNTGAQRTILFLENGIYYVNSVSNLLQWYDIQLEFIGKTFMATYIEVLLYQICAAKQIIQLEIERKTTFQPLKTHYRNCQVILVVASQIIGSYYSKYERLIEKEKVTNKSFHWTGTIEELKLLFKFLSTEYNGGVLQSKTTFKEFSKVFNVDKLNDITPTVITWISYGKNGNNQIYDLRAMVEILFLIGKINSSQYTDMLFILRNCFCKDDGSDITTPKVKEVKDLEDTLFKLFPNNAAIMT